jgi:hypothetical protein
VARPGPDPNHQIRAFELLSQGRSLAEAREILRREGIEVGGLETVRRWARVGARAASWLQENNEAAEENTTHEFIRQKYAHFLDNLIARGFDELDKGDGLYKDIAPLMARFAREQTLALGGYAAAKVDVTGIGSAAELDPATRAVVEAMQAKAAARDQEILNSGGTE